jgi:redox-sensitive bicupin YhaK (pirin superfamily)
MVAQGPFVMNTQQEIYQAYQDYQEGKFGIWGNVVKNSW